MSEKKKIYRDLMLVVISLLISFFGGLGLINLFAPQLLGKPIDLQMVQTDKKVPPFFDGVFRDDDYNTQKYLIRDPFIKRAKPLFPDKGLMGPNDILGFRNRSIPDVCDIITIGDSQTYGRNAVLEMNWPSQLASRLNNKKPVVYNMAVGAWGAIEYFEIFPKSLLFHPRIVIVAFYSGNDAHDSFRMAYSNERWENLRPHSRLKLEDAPKVVFPPYKADSWTVQFKDGIKTTFNARLRYTSNKDHPAIHAGYAVMAEVARRIAEMATESKVRIVFTIIPTKELVYAEKIKEESIKAPEDYIIHINAERKNVANLEKDIREIPGAVYIDVLKPLQKAALEPEALYPESWDGHPIGAGYRVIAESLAPAAEGFLPERPKGLVAVNIGHKRFQYFLIKNNELLSFESERTLRKNGWRLEDATLVRQRDIANVPYGRIIHAIDPENYGPHNF